MEGFTSSTLAAIPTKELMKASWMREITVGAKHQSLLSRQAFTVTGVDWGTQMVMLLDALDQKKAVRLERFYEYFSQAKP
jgi:hypothetical protein